MNKFKVRKRQWWLGFGEWTNEAERKEWVDEQRKHYHMYYNMWAPLGLEEYDDVLPKCLIEILMKFHPKAIRCRRKNNPGLDNQYLILNYECAEYVLRCLQNAVAYAPQTE